MLQIISKKLHAITFRYIDKNKNSQSLTLLPDINVGITKNQFEAIKDHPLFIAMRDRGELFVINKELDIKGEKEGLALVDSKEFGEELVVTEQMALANEKYIPSKETLKAYNGVGEKTAQKIMDMMPEGGWSSKKAFKEATAQFEIDWSSSGLKAKDL